MDVKRRAPRTTRKQYEIIIDFLENNEDIFVNEKNSPNFSVIQNKWLELSEKLNTSNSGPQKSVKEWRNVISEWKTNTKKKFKAIKNNENDSDYKLYLRDEEQRLIKLLQKDTVKCNDNSKEENVQNFSLTDLCEVSLTEGSPSKLQINKTENINQLPEMINSEEKSQHEKQCKKPDVKPKISYKIYKRKSRNMIRRINNQRKIKNNRQNVIKVIEANKKLTKSIEACAESVANVARAVEYLAQSLLRASQPN